MVSGQLQGPATLPPGTRWIGGWVGPRVGRDTVSKRKIPSPSQESNPGYPLVQPVASRYTDWITCLNATRCNQKFADWVDNEIYSYNNKHSLRSNTKGYGGKTH
jgi:hypothetical protein